MMGACGQETPVICPSAHEMHTNHLAPSHMALVSEQRVKQDGFTTGDMNVSTLGKPDQSLAGRIETERCQIMALLGQKGELRRIATAQTLQRLGNYLYKCGRHADAAAAYSLGLTCASNVTLVADTYTALAALAARCEDLQPLERFASAALGAAPEHRWEPYYYMMLLHAAHGNHKAAAVAFLDAVHSFGTFMPNASFPDFLSTAQPFVGLLSPEDVVEYYRLLERLADTLQVNADALAVANRILSERAKLSFLYPELCGTNPLVRCSDAKSNVRNGADEIWQTVAGRLASAELLGLSMTSHVEHLVNVALEYENMANARAACRIYDELLGMTNAAHMQVFIEGCDAFVFAHYRRAVLTRALPYNSYLTKKLAFDSLNVAADCFNSASSQVVRSVVPALWFEIHMARLGLATQLGKSVKGAASLAEATMMAPHSLRLEAFLRSMCLTNSLSQLSSATVITQTMVEALSAPRLRPVMEGYRRTGIMFGQLLGNPDAGIPYELYMLGLEHAVIAEDPPFYNRLHMPAVPLHMTPEVDLLLDAFTRGALSPELAQRFACWLRGALIAVPADIKYTERIAHLKASPAWKSPYASHRNYKVLFYCDTSAWRTSTAAVVYLTSDLFLGPMALTQVRPGECPTWYGNRDKMWFGEIKLLCDADYMRWSVYASYEASRACTGAWQSATPLDFARGPLAIIVSGVRRDHATTLVVEYQPKNSQAKPPYIIGTTCDWGSGRLAQPMYDDASHGDRRAHDGIWSRCATVDAGTDVVHWRILPEPVSVARPLAAANYTHTHVIRFDTTALTSYIRVTGDAQ